MATINEKVRMNELGSEDEGDPELREIMNELVRVINRSNERLEQLEEGKISGAEIRKLQRADKKETREINRRLREYKKRQGKG